MINYALDSDTSQIYQMWKDIFSFDDNGYTDYFFSELYDPKTTLCIKENDEVVAILSSMRHDYMINSKIIKGSMIFGVATKEAYRKKGYMDSLMKCALNIKEHQELVTFIQAYDPSLYVKYGFEMLYYRNKYTVLRDDIKSISIKGCTKDFHYTDLLRFYGHFTSRFNGYMIRDEEYFQKYIEEVKEQNGSIVVCIDSHNRISGYMSMFERDDHIEIEECLYYDALTLMKFLSLALKLKDKVELHTTSKENLSKILPNVKKEKYGYTMARINDYDLFNKLFDSDVHCVKDGFDLINKPLFIRECI